jgi:hypothetical protein
MSESTGLRFERRGVVVCTHSWEQHHKNELEILKRDGRVLSMQNDPDKELTAYVMVHPRMTPTSPSLPTPFYGYNATKRSFNRLNPNKFPWKLDEDYVRKCWKVRTQLYTETETGGAISDDKWSEDSAFLGSGAGTSPYSL